MVKLRQVGDRNGQIKPTSTFLSPTGVPGPRIIRFNVQVNFGG